MEVFPRKLSKRPTGVLKDAQHHLYVLLLFSDPIMSDSLNSNGPVPDLPVPQHLLVFAQVHVHCISDAIQPSRPQSPSSPSLFSLSQHQGLFQ